MWNEESTNKPLVDEAPLPLLVYSKTKMKPRDLDIRGNASFNANLLSVDGNSSKIMSAMNEAISTLEYLLSLPLEDPMKEPYYPDEILPIANNNNSITTNNKEDDSCASLAVEDLDGSISISSLLLVGGSMGAAPEGNGRDLRSQLSKKTSSVSFQMRRSSRSLNRSKSFDTTADTSSVSSCERFHLSLSQHNMVQHEQEAESRTSVFSSSSAKTKGACRRQISSLSRSYTFHESSTFGLRSSCGGSDKKLSNPLKPTTSRPGNLRRSISKMDISDITASTKKSNPTKTTHNGRRMQKRADGLCHASSRSFQGSAYFRTKPQKELEEDPMILKRLITRQRSFKITTASDDDEDTTISSLMTSSSTGSATSSSDKTLSSRRNLMRSYHGGLDKSCNSNSHFHDSSFFVTGSRIRRLNSKAA